MDASANETTIGGSYGDFIAAHEYGHAFHEKGLGGNEGGNCPSPHYVNGAYNLKCAYSEEFANYHAEALGYDHFNFEGVNRSLGCTQHDSDGLCQQRQGQRDGSVVAGAVASYLLDISDPANESFDNVEYPGSYVADIIETCEVNRFGFYIEGQA